MTKWDSTPWLPELTLLTVLLAASCTAYDKPSDFNTRPAGWSDHPCGPSGASDTFRVDGFLADATYYGCDTLEVEGSGAGRFTAYTGQTTVVNGGSLALDLTWADAASLAGRLAVVDFSGDDGWFLTRLPELDDPAPFDAFLLSSAPSGNHTLRIAVDDGTGVEEGEPVLNDAGEVLGRPPELHLSQWLEIPISIVRVQSGDVQVSINWGTATDVDLYVVDPLGEEIFYGHRNSESGGELDLDSNAACSSGPQNENIYWPTGGAPLGEYEVRVNYWSACNHSGRTTWRVTVVTGGEDVEFFDGAFEADDAVGGAEGAGVPVTAFTWGG